MVRKMGSFAHRGLIKGMLASALGAVGLIAAIGPLHAEVKREEKSYGNFVIELRGAISQADADELARNATRFWYRSPPQIFLNGTGGDLDATMPIPMLRRCE